SENHPVDWGQAPHTRRPGAARAPGRVGADPARGCGRHRRGAAGGRGARRVQAQAESGAGGVGSRRSRKQAEAEAGGGGVGSRRSRKQAESEAGGVGSRRSREQAFEIALGAAAAYRERVGHLEVPRGHVETVTAFDGWREDVRLGVWVTTTRSRRAKLPAQRIAALDALDMRWT
ncbi:helicase associated domain-containing protein, partial [Streptomyces microflavus]